MQTDSATAPTTEELRALVSPIAFAIGFHPGEIEDGAVFHHAPRVIGLCVVACDCEVALETVAGGFVCRMTDGSREWISGTCASRVEAACRALALKHPTDEAYSAPE